MELLVLLGETGAGKDWLQERLVKEQGYTRLVTYTTRPIRDGEVDGVDYHFINNDEFLSQLSEFIEHRRYDVTDGDIWYYGSKEQKEDAKYVVILDKKGYETVKSKMKCVGIYISVVHETERYFRALDRHGDGLRPFDNKELYRRIQDDRVKFEGVHEVVDFVIPQLYTEETYNLLLQVL